MKTISEVMVENLLQNLMTDLFCNIIDLQTQFKISPDTLRDIVHLELYSAPKEVLTESECYEFICGAEDDPAYIALTDRWPILHQYLNMKLGC